MSFPICRISFLSIKKVFVTYFVGQILAEICRKRYSSFSVLLQEWLSRLWNEISEQYHYDSFPEWNKLFSFHWSWVSSRNHRFYAHRRHVDWGRFYHWLGSLLLSRPRSLPIYQGQSLNDDHAMLWTERYISPFKRHSMSILILKKIQQWKFCSSLQYWRSWNWVRFSVIALHSRASTVSALLTKI